jgi:hypothetical protein
VIRPFSSFIRRAIPAIIAKVIRGQRISIDIHCQKFQYLPENEPQAENTTTATTPAVWLAGVELLCNGDGCGLRFFFLVWGIFARRGRRNAMGNGGVRSEHYPR